MGLSAVTALFMMQPPPIGPRSMSRLFEPRCALVCTWYRNRQQIIITNHQIDSFHFIHTTTVASYLCSQPQGPGHVQGLCGREGARQGMFYFHPLPSSSFNQFSFIIIIINVTNVILNVSHSL